MYNFDRGINEKGHKTRKWYKKENQIKMTTSIPSIVTKTYKEIKILHRITIPIQMNKFHVKINLFKHS